MDNTPIPSNLNRNLGDTWIESRILNLVTDRHYGLKQNAVMSMATPRDRKRGDVRDAMEPKLGRTFRRLNCVAWNILADADRAMIEPIFQ